MSSTLAPVTVVSVAAVTLSNPSGQGVYTPTLLWTTPASTPIRVEGVYMVAEYAGPAGFLDQFAIQLVDSSGLVLCNQASGIQKATPIDTYSLTWATDLVDTAQSGEQYWSFEEGEFGESWWSGALPPYVLQPGSDVVFNAFRGNTTDGSGPLLVDQIAIAYTGAGSTATASTAVIPFLVPTTGG